MKDFSLIIIGAILLVGCENTPQVVKEPWIEQSVSDWPSFALTNEISFDDTTYFDIANSFLVNTGYDTIGVSCKHFFMIFENQLGINKVDLGDKFIYWNMYPKNKKGDKVAIKRLINENSNESIGEYNTLKVRDWIIFELKEQNMELYSLKVRYSPVESKEVVYAVGWGLKQKGNTKPVLRKLQCIKNLGNYFYVKPLTTDSQPQGTSGSPVIDKNGYLVGIVSGQDGKMGVIGGVSYLTQMFDEYGVKYKSISD